MSLPTLRIPINSPSSGIVIKQGDTIPEITFEFTDLGVDFTTSEIKIQIYDLSKRLLNLSVGNGITVISATTFEIDQIEAVNNTFPIGTFIGDLQITDASGVRETYFNIEYTIVKEYTR